VLLFTDDDVHPPIDWIEYMIAPILNEEADAVAGGIRIAPALKRPWLLPEHEMWLASTEYSGCPDWHPLIGANMAVHRRVFSKVGGFDPEIGPGALGHAEDTLFSLQMRRAGFVL
jgi:GT2 family glycosyltransferase